MTYVQFPETEIPVNFRQSSKSAYNKKEENEFLYLYAPGKIGQ